MPSQAVIEVIHHRAASHPERVALISGGQKVTYGELWARIAAAAAELKRSGVARGDRVLLAAPSIPAFAFGYFAAHYIGAVAVALDPSAPVARREDLVRRTQPAVVFGARSEGVRGGTQVRSIEELQEASGREAPFEPPSLDSLADVLFTTGTTARPKGVRLTHRNVAAAVAHITAVMGTAPTDVEVIPIPLYHSAGLGRLRCCLAVGATAVLVPGFRLPGEVFSALDRHNATGLSSVPAGLAVLLRAGRNGLGAFADRLRYLETGTAPMPVEHKRLLMDLLPRTSLFMYYGLTEASRSTFIEFHRDRAHLDTAGQPAPGVTIEARDGQRNTSAASKGGILWISGAHVSAGYWDDPDLTAKNFVDGWMRTGDVGEIDAGFVRLHGREDDMVNVGGFNVSPEEVERVLVQLPAVAEAACIGVPDPRKIAGSVVRAYLVLAAGQARPDDVQISQWVAARLESYKVPAQYIWVAELPRTTSGKLLRATLRSEAAASTAPTTRLRSDG